MSNSMQSLYVVTVVLTALVMGMTLGHALETPQKLRMDGPEWLRAQHTLYLYFARIGGVIEIAAIVSAIALTILLRGYSPAFLRALVAAVLFLFAFFPIWVLVTQRVNVRTAAWTAETIPSDWTHWRARWEWSHVSRFVLHLIAFIALLGSLMTFVPPGQS